MSMNIESCKIRFCRELDDLFAAAVDRLDQVPFAEQRRRAKDLAAILREQTHSSYLRNLTAEQLAEWVLTLLDFVESRTTDVGVSLLPLVADYPLLVTNVLDVPYLVDSLRACLADLQHRFQMVCHPIFPVRRELKKVLALGPEAEGAPKESLIVLELRVEEETAVQLIAGITRVLTAVLRIDRDRERLERQLEKLHPAESRNAASGFCSWLGDGNFLPFAYRRRRVRRLPDGGLETEEVAGTALGMPLPTEPPEPARRRASRSRELLVEETAMISPVLRAEPLICVGFRRPSADDGWEEHEFFGLFPEKVLAEPTLQVPILKWRVTAALTVLGVAANTHDYRKTIEIFNTFPKIELFFMAEDELLEAVRSLVGTYRDATVRVLPSESLAVGGLTLLLVLPKGFYTLGAVRRMETYLARYFNTERVVSRVVHVGADYSSHLLRLTPGTDPVRIDLCRLERSLTRIACPWKVRLRDLLERNFGEAEARRLWLRYGEVFARNYQLRVHPRFALRDIRCIEQVLAEGRELFDLWGPFSGAERYCRLQFYSTRRSYLNELMPLLENLNLMVIEEIDFDLSLAEGAVYLKSFGIVPRRRDNDLAALRGSLLATLDALRRGELENDYLNRLLVLTGLSWREIDIFRGYRNYYFQLGSPYSKKRVAFALINNPEVARLLFRYFEGRFADRSEWDDPMAREDRVLSPLRMELVAALQAVSDVNEDSILRILFNLIDSTVRTNFFLRRDRPDYFFSFKISAIGIIDMPAPRPLYEIYVHSATMEGIHLRGGKVARGGLRWSDRPDDFRTEVLGLMKTQMTKNALIVPVGSKGGFVVKTPYTGREEGLALAKEAYKTLISGMLDLTDNRVGPRIVRPEGVVAYDEEDPYLVVAADKGTAHLPDTANAVSQAYGFWLDDAFASGGSQGYDHKKLGITARGAWECVKRHFRELGTDIQAQPFTVVGIGDMSGDVFGNGMLQSRCIRLLAAFDHRHIFLDPDPDPEKSFIERQRLFNLPRSSWDDYDRKLISAGGGIYSRETKEIPLSEPIRNWLGVHHESMDAPGLIRLLLTAEVDLLWNGGIGTYVKAGTEKNEDAGDRANDGVRIDARQLRAKVVGEGGNLGFTQRGRIEYALGGGRINTDAVDNSAGVDCSDHEVNLKIFMQHLRAQGLVASVAERDQQLEAVTDDVCRSVVANNYTQSLCLSLEQRRCARTVEAFLELAERLSGAGLMDRRGEFLPTGKEVLARESRAFMRPELAILMAYGKMQIFQALTAADLHNWPGVESYLFSYFPETLGTKFRGQLSGHPLAAEITATVITNTLVDRAGSSFCNGMVRKYGMSTADAVASWLAFDQVLDGEAMRRRIYALDNRAAADCQHDLLLRLEDALVALCEGALDRGLRVSPKPEMVADFRKNLQAFEKALGGILPEAQWQQCKLEANACEEKGLDAETARRLASLPYLSEFLAIKVLAETAGCEMYAAAQAFMEVRRLLAYDDIFAMAQYLPLRDQWDRQALRNLTKTLADVGFRLTETVLEKYAGNPEACLAKKRRELNNYRRLREGLRGATLMNLHPLMILVKAAEELIS